MQPIGRERNSREANKTALRSGETSPKNVGWSSMIKFLHGRSPLARPVGAEAGLHDERARGAVAAARRTTAAMRRRECLSKTAGGDGL